MSGEEVHFAFLAEVPVSKGLSSPESSEWLDAMASEFKSILKNETWEIVPRSEVSNIVGSRFVLRDKLGADNLIERRKARVVTKGYSQEYGRDFTQTFAPVARLDSIRLAVAIAVRKDLHIHQYDITTAYLNGHMEDKVFMEIPREMKSVLEYIV